jgi:hypothetical protein
MDRAATREEARVVGYNWHGGKSSALYAFASTGCVQSEEHRSGVLYELNRAIEDEEAAGRLTPHWLHWLMATVRYAEVVPVSIYHPPIPDERYYVIPEATFKYIEHDPLDKEK